VNVDDLMRLQPSGTSDGLPEPRVRRPCSPADRPGVFAGTRAWIHRLTYRRATHDNLHVRGYKEEGTTTTPFDMVMLNDLDRYHLVIDVIDRVPGLGANAAHLRQWMVDARAAARIHTRDHGEDPPEISGWRWQVQGSTTTGPALDADPRRQRGL